MKNTVLLITAVLFALNISCKKEPVDEKTYPTDGLVSYFNFDNNLKDKLGNTPDGTNHGSAVFSDGKSGQAITLNGFDQYIEFGRGTFRSGNNISVSAWLKRTGNGGIYTIICDDFGVWVAESNAGMAISLPITESAAGPCTQNQWVHLVGTYDGTNIKVYINGFLEAITNHPGDIADLGSNLKLGNFGSAYWAGSVDDLFIYSKVLSPAEVLQLYDYH
jgi:hypothetical protein